MNKRIHDLTGQKFGRLLVKEQAEYLNNSKMSRWICECDCGNNHISRSDSLKRGNTKSCGCLKLEKTKEMGYNNRKEYGEASLNLLYKDYINGAIKRELEFTLTKEQFKEITSKNCCYCNSMPSKVSKGKHGYGEYIYNGIDRIDNLKGYTLENCVPCCTVCNYMKRNMSVDEFLDHIKRIYGHSYLP